MSVRRYLRRSMRHRLDMLGYSKRSKRYVMRRYRKSYRRYK